MMAAPCVPPLAGLGGMGTYGDQASDNSLNAASRNSFRSRWISDILGYRPFIKVLLNNVTNRWRGFGIC